MNMIWHDDQPVKAKLLSISIDTDFQDDVAGGFGENPTFGAGEGDEERFVIGLVVRKFAAIFVFSLHLGVRTGGDARASIVFLDSNSG